MGGGGSDDEEVYFNVDMVTQRVMEDGQWFDARVRGNLSRLKFNSYGIPEVLNGYHAVGLHPLMNYYNFSTWYNKQAFPTVVLQGVTIPEEQILSIISDKEQIPEEEIANLSVSWGVPITLDWISYRLQEEYNYEINTEILVIGEDTFKIIDYNVVTVNTKQHYEVITEYVPPEVEPEPTPEVVSTDTNTEEHPVEPPVDPEPPVIIVPFAPASYAYVAKYAIKKDEKNLARSWIYFPLVGTNSHIGQVNIPGLQSPIGGKSTTFETFPVTLLRSNYFSINEYNISTKELDAGDEDFKVYRPSEITEESYRDTEYTVNSLGLTLEVLLDSINENPSIEEISDVFLLCGLDPADTHTVTSRMLFETFEMMGRYDDIFNLNARKTVTMTRGPFNIALEWTGAFKESLELVIGEEGFHKHYSGTITRMEEECVEGIDPETGNPTIICTPIAVSYPAMVIEKQETELIVVRISVAELKGTTVIGRSYQDDVSATATSSKLIIPVPVEVMDKLTPIEKIEAMERTLRFVFYAAQLHIEKLKWYETGLFKVLLQVIALIVIVVVNFIPYIGQGVSAALTAAFEALFIGIAIQLAIMLITSIVDVPFLSEILTAVAFVVGMATGYINISSITDVVMTGVQLATLAMEVATGMINLDTLEIMEDRQQLASDYEDKSNELAEIEKQLGMGVTTEELVELTNQEKLYLIPPSTYYDLQFNTVNNFNLLFNSSYDNVSTFYNNKFDSTR